MEDTFLFFLPILKYFGVGKFISNSEMCVKLVSVAVLTNVRVIECKVGCMIKPRN